MNFRLCISFRCKQDIYIFLTQHIFDLMIIYKLNNVENLRRINLNSRFYLMLVHIWLKNVVKPRIEDLLCFALHTFIHL